MLQQMVPFPGVYEQHKVDSMCYLRRRKLKEKTHWVESGGGSGEVLGGVDSNELQGILKEF